MSALLKYKGLGDILVAVILTLRPSLVYDSLPARYLSALSGLVSLSAAIRLADFKPYQAHVERRASSGLQPSISMHGFSCRNWASRSSSQWTCSSTAYLCVNPGLLFFFHSI